MVDIAEGEVVEVQGSATLPYKLRNVLGVYSCSCPAWINAGGPIDLRTCKHLKQYRGEAAEIARVGDAAKGGKVSAPKKPKGDGDDDEAGDGTPPVLLAHKWENDQELIGWWMSEKLDGVRAWWDGTRFVSRLGNAFLAPEWFTKGLPNHALDGELWLARQEFQKCVSIVRSANAGELWKQLKYLIFDAPAVDDGFEGRIEQVKKLFGDGQHPYATPVEHVRCEGYDHLKKELARVEGLGGEGLMMRQPGSKYVNGRSTTLLKVKTFHDAEGRVLSHEPGKGKHKGRLGALVVEMHDGTRFNVGTGFTDKEREDPPVVGSIITYRYQELTKDGVPRFPSYVGQAIDKDAPTVPTAPTAPTAPKPAPAPATKSAATVSDAFRRFEVDEKFWAISLHEGAHTVRFGKIGTDGQSKTKDFGDAATAKKEYDKLVSEKTKKGYVEVGADQTASGDENDETDDAATENTESMSISAATPVTAPTSPVSADDGAAVRDVVKKLSDAWRKKTWAEIESALDANCIFLKPNGSRVEGAAACAHSYRHFVENTRLIRFSESDHRVDVWGDVAMTSCAWEMTYADGGRPLREKGTETMTLSKQTGAWRVVWRRLDVVFTPPVPPSVAAADEDVADESGEGDVEDA